MTLTDPVTLVYDGACSFCIRSLALLKRFDGANRIRLLDGNDQAAVESLPQLAGIDLDAEMKAIVDGRVFGGFDAFRRAAMATPLLRPLAAVGYFPGVAPIGRRIYALVAANRRCLR